MFWDRKNSMGNSQRRPKGRHRPKSATDDEGGEKEEGGELEMNDRHDDEGLGGRGGGRDETKRRRKMLH
ncbi:hypothetical protein PAMP_015951 [Pampus punctatissimus]